MKAKNKRKAKAAKEESEQQEEKTIALQGSLGYVILDDHKITIATVSATKKVVLCDRTLKLPWKTEGNALRADEADRQRHRAEYEHLKKISQKVEESLVKNSTAKVGCVILAGPGRTKVGLQARLSPKLQDIVRKVITIKNNDVSGLNEAIDCTPKLLHDIDLERNLEQLRKFFQELESGRNDKVSYGEEDVRAVVEAGAVCWCVRAAPPSPGCWTTAPYSTRKSTSSR